MKKIFVFIILFSIFGCSNKSVNPVNTEQNEINGQFTGWNSANGDSLFWRVSVDSVEQVLTYAKVSETGYFKINLPIPPDQILHNYERKERVDSVYFEIKDNIQFSDATAKYVSFYLAHYGRITSAVFCGDDIFDSTSVVGNYQIYYYYFDRATQVNGKYSVFLKNQFLQGYERSIVTEYKNVKFNKGWNQIIIKLVSTENNVRLFQVLNEKRSQTEWFISFVPNEFVGLL